MKENIDFLWNSLFYAFLVYTFHNDSIELSGFDTFYLKSYFKFY